MSAQPGAGRHPWREYVMDLYTPARIAWERMAEVESIGYATEFREFAQANPGPTLRGFLLDLAGTYPHRTSTV